MRSKATPILQLSPAPVATLDISVPTHGWRMATLSASAGKQLFLAREDFDAFERLLGATANYDHPTDICAWCMLPDRIVLLLKRNMEDPEDVCRWWMSEYAVWYQQRHGARGKLFLPQPSMQAPASPADLLKTLVRIHQLPVNERLVPSADAYRWTSHAFYAGHRQAHWVKSERLLSIISPRSSGRIRTYQQLMQGRLELTQLPRRPREAKPLGQTPEAVEAPPSLGDVKTDLDTFIAIYCQLRQVRKVDLLHRGGQRRLREKAAEFSWLAEKLGLTTVENCALQFQLPYATLRSAINGLMARRASSLHDLLARILDQDSSK